MPRHPLQRFFCGLLLTLVVLGSIALPRRAAANGSDLPAQIVVQGFIKAEDGRLRLLARFPLVLLSSFSLPKRGPGYLDLAHIEDRLKQAAVATGQQIGLYENGVLLVPTIKDARLSLLSNRSFASYSAALAHFREPPLPTDTDLFWNQGYFDTQLEYSLQSARPDISVRVNVAAELGSRLKLRLEYQPVDGPARTYEIRGASGRIPLDPGWLDTVWIFLKAGFVDAFAFDRFLFLVCLVAPFRHIRSLLAIVMVLSGMQALTLTAVAEGALAGAAAAWLPPLFDTVVAATVVCVAIGNLVAPSLRVRWLIGALIGALGGFGLGRLLADIAQFAGTHTLVSVVSFNLGVVAGEFVTLAIALLTLRLLFATVGPVLGVVVLSAVVGHMAWHWMLDGAHEFDRQIGPATASSLSPVLAAAAVWLVPAALIGALAFFLPQRSDGLPVTSLLRALRGRSEQDDTRT